MSAQPLLKAPRISAAEYLRLERQAERKSEYIDGEIQAMAGTSTAHTRIVSGIHGILFSQLEDKVCEPIMSDHRVCTPDDRLYVYPDVFVVCDPEYLDGQFDTITNPVVIFEVLSPSTENLDRTTKFYRYRTIPSLRDYVLVSQERVLVEHYSRAVQFDREHWWVRILENAEDELVLDSVGCRLKLDRIYKRVTFSTSE